jgi:adenylate cyclase
MAREIEDKYLVTNTSWREIVDESSRITQTYLLAKRQLTIRTRLEDGRPAILCIKLAEQSTGTPEYEWQIPKWLARLCSKLSSRTLQKVRHRIAWGDLTIEVDEFEGKLSGLIVAEVERPSVDHQYDLPTWFGLNVTPDERYKNARLIKTGLPT